jgi:hypothetical protein
MLIRVLAIPPLFEAVTTYATAGSITVLGVPVMTPVAASRLMPAGRAGLTLNIATAASEPPGNVAGSEDVVDDPTVKLSCEGE